MNYVDHYMLIKIILKDTSIMTFNYSYFINAIYKIIFINNASINDKLFFECYNISI